MTFHTLNELIADGVRGRYVLVRSDLNVPLDGSTVTDDGRIKASLPVLAKLTDAGARVLVTAHLGRPKGAPEDKYSLKPAAARLAELAAFKVSLADDTVGDVRQGIRRRAAGRRSPGPGERALRRPRDVARTTPSAAPSRTSWWP